MSLALSELDADEAYRLLEVHHLARLTCHGADGVSAVPVTYSVSDHDHVCIQAPVRVAAALGRMNTTVRLEVDEVEGPTKWSTVIGWGFVEGDHAGASGACTCRIRLTTVRGFHHGRPGHEGLDSHALR